MTDPKPAGAPNGAPARVIDLDVARAARAEAAGEPVVLRLGGHDFTLPVEMPLDFALHARDGDLRAAVEALLGEDAEAFFALRPSIPDMKVLAEQASEIYGVDQGKSEASPASSRSTGRSSRRTSRGSTTSTSGKR